MGTEENFWGEAS